MISGAYTSSEKAGRLFFKRTAVFFWEDSEWGAGLFARAPKGEPVYFSMICSASSSRHRLICHVVSARHPARDIQKEIPHKPNTLLSPVFGICSRFGSIQPIRPPGALPCTSSYFSMVQPLLCFIKQSRTYSTAFFHFLIFVRNVPKGATVLTWINL